MTPIVGYWDVRGLAQPIRNLLVYQGVEFEDKRYKFGPEPDYDREEWLAEKPTLGLRFPNLPYYFDDDVKMTQSLAIVRYLARKHDLAGRDEEETLELDMLEQQARDLLWGLMMAIASPNYEETRPKYEEKMESLLQPWDEQLQEKEWVIGDRITYVDFLLYEALDWNCELNAGAFEGFPVLTAYTKRFEELPNIDEYFASDKYNKYPMLGPMFQWGFEKE
ncbi:glutathione S-transferase Mu 4-like [Dermacentor variabilis]|uniref:glutathione S-transferase Mu 4-like n=1 Tax=Dermacentor variabilis TaxID=34621 RepID=UPI003F5C5598